MEAIKVFLKSPTVRRWVLALFALLVLLFGGKLGLELSPADKAMLVGLVVSVIGLSNANDIFTKRAVEAGKDAVAVGPPGAGVNK